MLIKIYVVKESGYHFVDNFFINLHQPKQLDLFNDLKKIPPKKRTAKGGHNRSGLFVVKSLSVI